jgi:pimeloyl-ACP methyl ester carboxylesterase
MAFVTTEGDDLYYELQGQGPALLMIPPGGGDGWHYHGVAERLADEFRVVTYDRRANARSTINQPQNFTIAQQSRDALAVLRAAGESEAFVFGNSSGAVIALDLAISHPEAVCGAVVHEAPVAGLHPRARHWQRFFAKVYLTGFRWGPNVAALRFFLGVQLPVRQMIAATREVNAHRAASSLPYLDDRTAAAFLVEHELLPVTTYLPDLAGLGGGGTGVVIALGEWAEERHTWIAEIAERMAAELGGGPVLFPGHHGAFLDQPEAFAARLREVLHSLAARTAA